MLTIDQALQLSWHMDLHYGECTRHIGPRGGVTTRIEHWRPNGRCQTWKTRPGKFRLPIKYGLKTYGAITETNAAEFHLAVDCPLQQMPLFEARSSPLFEVA